MEEKLVAVASLLLVSFLLQKQTEAPIRGSRSAGQSMLPVNVEH